MKLRLLGVLALLGLAACDSVPGPPDLDATAPVLRSFSFSPQRVEYENLPDDQIGPDGEARFTVDMEVAVTDADGSAFDVYYSILEPLRHQPVHEGQLSLSSGNVYTGAQQVSLSPGTSGNYTVLIYAVDETGRLSNQVRGVLTFLVLTNDPPVIEQIVAPDVFTPPGTLTFVAVVTDPNGIENVQRVVVRTPAGPEYAMFDDGQTQGDQAAGDGRFTIRFDVPAAAPGPQTFTFQAFDRAGLASAEVEKTVTIQ